MAPVRKFLRNAAILLVVSGAAVYYPNFHTDSALRQSKAPQQADNNFTNDANMTGEKRSAITTRNQSIVFDNKPLARVEPADKILKHYEAPIVVEKYRLVFFHQHKIASTAWKVLFHRMMGVEPKPKPPKAKNWNSLHWPRLNKLKYLWDYNVTEANRMMHSPEWTRAIFVRNPHERILSAYLDKVVARNFGDTRKKCCPVGRECLQENAQGFQDFVDLLDAESCMLADGHWRPQSRRVDAKHWPSVNYVGHMERLQDDARALLVKIGAWDEHRESAVLFERPSSAPSSHSSNNGNTTTSSRHHYTDSKRKMQQYYDTRALFDEVTELYREDYEHPVLGLELVEPDWIPSESEKE